MDDAGWTPPPPPPRNTEGRRALKVVLIVFGVLTLALGGCAAVAVTALTRATSNINLGLSDGFPFEPQNVTPISVPTRACPYLLRVRDTAADAGTMWFSTAGHDATPGATVRSQFGPPLLKFDAALRAAIPNTPEPIAAALLRTLAQVQIGERELGAATSAGQYFDATIGPVSNGYSDLGYASALMGEACGFSLNPLFGSQTTTSTTRR
jgi:hypothetical protein